MPDLTSAQAWVTIFLGILMPFLVKAIKWAFTEDASGKLAFGITLGCAGGLSIAVHYLAGLFAAPPAWLSGDLTEIFLLSQIVYQLLKEKLNL
jgi:hypothetical protein